jgi:hypothetical protein
MFYKRGLAQQVLLLYLDISAWVSMHMVLTSASAYVAMHALGDCLASASHCI